MPSPQIKRSRGQKPKRRRTVFSFKAPQAGEVFLAGDFNNWDVRRHPMRKNASGWWKKIVVLPPGRYEYKFMVDGRWQIDPAAQRLCRNTFGTRNNVIHIETQPASTAKR